MHIGKRDDIEAKNDCIMYRKLQNIVPFSDLFNFLCTMKNYINCSLAISRKLHVPKIFEKQLELLLFNIKKFNPI